MVEGLNKWKVNEGREEGVRGTPATPSAGPLGASSLPEGGGCVDPPRGDPSRAGCPDSPRAGLVLGVARSTLTLTPGEGKPRPPGCPAHLTSEVLGLLAFCAGSVHVPCSLREEEGEYGRGQVTWETALGLGLGLQPVAGALSHRLP